MIKRILLFLLIVNMNLSNAQPVNVQVDYNSLGDCLFSAYNNTKVPMYLNVDLADLENTSFPETMPYVKKLEPGFSNLFTLQRDPDADVPRFHYEIKVYRSDPQAKVDLKFPYLFPFAIGERVRIFDVKEIDGFWGQGGLSGWTATGFYAKEGQPVFACRNGIVVEVAGAERSGDAANWYNTWTNAVTLLQDDGTLICYHNVIDKEKKLQLGKEVYAGQPIGKIAKGASDLTILIFHDSFFSKYPVFIIPQFVLDDDSQGMLNSAKEYIVVHPEKIRELEMSARERKKILNKKRD